MGRERYLIEIIIVGKKTHTYSKERADSINLEVSVNTTEESGISTSRKITVEPKDLYEVPSGGILGFVRWVFTGIAFHYILVVDEAGEPIKETHPLISGKVLRVARDWKGLGKAIHDSFGSRFEIPRLALVGAVGVGILIIVFLVWRGYIPLPRSWGT